MTGKQMRAWEEMGASYLQILNAAIRDGDEFPQALNVLVWEFNLYDEEVEQLKNEYDEQALTAHADAFDLDRLTGEQQQ